MNDLDLTEIKVIEPGIFWLKFPNQYTMASTFVRPQEFYESAFPEIRGQFFTLDKFIEKYSEFKNGHFSYYEDWGGFNIPGHVLEDFFFRFQYHLSDKERWMEKQLPLNGRKKFYVIGTENLEDTSALRHEIAHALFYLDDEYRESVERKLDEQPRELMEKMEAWLKRRGYAEPLYRDETQAYLIEQSGGEFKRSHRFEPPKDHAWFHENYTKTLRKHGIDKFINVD